MSRGMVWSEGDLEEAKQRMLVRGGVVVPALKANALAAGLMAAPSKDLRGTSVVLNPSPVPNPAPSPYKSKWETAYASLLEQEHRAGIVKSWWYEPFSLWLPGKVRYKPDFLVQYPDGLERKMEIIEVKGWSKNRRDGMTRLKIAAALFPCFTWILAYRIKGGGWEREYR